MHRSRVSINILHKAAQIGAAVIIALSAPTALPVRVAAGCGITLVGVARADGFEVFSAPHRLLPGVVGHFDGAGRGVLAIC